MVLSQLADCTSDDSIILCCLTQLSPRSLGLLSAASSHWRRIVHSDRPVSQALWNSVSRSYGALADEIRPQLPEQAGAAGLARACYSASRLDRLSWRRLRVSGMFAQEGHSAAVVEGRWVVVVGGFGHGISNDVRVADTRQLPRLEWTAVDMHGSRANQSYGHALTWVGGDTLALFGGVQYGGYQGDIADMDFMQVSVQELTGNWCPPQQLTTGTSRGYATLTLARHAGRAQLFVFGGIHQGEATDVLELYDLDQHAFSQPFVTGEPPAARFGHSAEFVSGSELDCGSLIISGGSDGSDLLRNGAELRSVHVLHVTAHTLSWSHPELSPAPADLGLGRCDASCLVGGHMLLFGGGARLSDAVTVLQVDQVRNETAPVPCAAPELEGDGPSPRLSHVGVRVGRYFLVQGGWCRQALSDAYVLDLAGGVESEQWWLQQEEEDEEEEEGPMEMVMLPNGMVVPRALLMQLLAQMPDGEDDSAEWSDDELDEAPDQDHELESEQDHELESEQDHELESEQDHELELVADEPPAEQHDAEPSADDAAPASSNGSAPAQTGSPADADASKKKPCIIA